jgi:hypothetical protein
MDEHILEDIHILKLNILGYDMNRHVRPVHPTL